MVFYSHIFSAKEACNLQADKKLFLKIIESMKESDQKEKKIIDQRFGQCPRDIIRFTTIYFIRYLCVIF